MFTQGFSSDLLTGAISKAFVGSIGAISTSSVYVDKLNAIRNGLVQRSQVYSEILASCIASIDVPETVDTKTNFSINDFSTYSVEITEQEATAIIASMEECRKKLANSTYISDEVNTTVGFGITDSLGQPYTICVLPDGYTHADAELGNIVTYIASRQGPVDASDSIVFRTSDGKYHFNWLIKTFGYSDTEYQDPVTIKECLSDIAFYNNLNLHPAWNLTRSIRALLTQLGITSTWNTVADGTTELCTTLHFTPSASDELGILQELSYHSYSLWWLSGHGRISFVGDILRDIAASSTINDVISEAISLVCTKDTGVSDFITQLEAKFSDQITSVRSIVSALAQAWHRGGFYGVYCWIVDFFDRAGRVSVSDSGVTLEFTDNSALIPQQYIAGAIAGVASTVLSMLSAVVSVLQPVVSAAFSLVSGLVKTFSQQAGYDYENYTTAKLVYLDDVALPFAPHALLQWKGNVTDLPSVIQSGFGVEYRLFYTHVPGGAIFFGFNDNNTFNAEFHPAICKYDLSSITDKGTWVFHKKYNSVIPTGFGTFLVGWRADQNITITPELCTSIYNTAEPIFLSSAEPDKNGCLDIEDDMSLRESIVQSLCLFLLWRSVLRRGNSTVNAQKVVTKCKGSFQTSNLIYYLSERYDVPTALIPGTGITAINPLNGLICSGNSWESALTDDQPSMDILYLMKKSEGTKPISWADIGSFVMEFSEGSVDQPTHISCPVSNYDISNLDDMLEIYDLWGGNRTVFPLHYAPINDEFNRFIGQIQYVDHSFSWLFQAPKYDRSTFWRNVLITNVVAAVITCSAAALTAVTVNAIRTKSAKLRAKTEQAWYAALDDPSTENIKAYRKAARRNNFWATIFGGTKYSMSDFWNYSSESFSIADALGSASNVLAELQGHMSGASEDKFNGNSSIDFNTLYKIIVGIDALI